MGESMLLSDIRRTQEADDKVDALFKLRQESFIILREQTLEELYKEFMSKTQFQKDYELFDRLKPRLLMEERYRGKWVVIYKGEIRAVDDDDRKLAMFIYGKYGNVPAYIGKVVEEEEVFELPSPELE